MGYGEIAEKSTQGLACRDRRPTVRQELTAQKTVLEERLKDINAALALLDANPTLEEFQETLRKVT